MKKVIGHYETKSGEIAFKVVSYLNGFGETRYSYTGKFGAGCADLASIKSSVSLSLKNRRGIKTIVDLFS